jgi:hypothetical protein
VSLKENGYKRKSLKSPKSSEVKLHRGVSVALIKLKKFPQLLREVPYTAALLN